MNRQELMKKITEKKAFSQLPKEDVELALDKFDKPRYIDEEKIKLTRDLLRKVFSVFTSEKLLNIKDRDPEWILKKHLSTRERFNHYPQVYKKIFSNFLLTNKKKIFVFDFGAGINGFSYPYLPVDSTYFGIEGIKQLVDLTNHYFKKNDLDGKMIQESLFNLNSIKEFILKEKGEKVLFLFKVIDSLEMLQDNYSKILLKEVTPLVDLVVVSFATRSLIKRERFKVNRKWIIDFIKENFELIDDFEIGNERYIKFKARFKFK